ncbi:MAG: hypothetical protein ACJ0PZ_04410 [Flavobacteriaceae bacterium]
MKTFNLTLFMIVSILINLVSQETKEANFERIFSSQEKILQEDNTDDIITQYNKITLILDTLAFYMEKPNQDFYVNLRTKYYSYTEENSNFDNPSKEFGVLFKKTITANDSIGYLTNLRLTPNISLENINLIEVEVKLVKVNSDADDLNNIIEGALDKLISDALGLQIIDELLSTQQDDNEKENLLFLQNFEIPLNSVEYSALSDENSERLLRSRENIIIPLEGQVQGQILRGSVAGGIVSFAGKLVRKIVGTPDYSKSKLEFTGVMQLYFTNKINSLIPPSIKPDLDKAVSYILMRNYGASKDYIDRVIQANSSLLVTDNSNLELSLTLSQFCNLANDYIDFIVPEELDKKQIKRFKKNYKDFFFKIMSAHAWNNKFKVYGVNGLIPDKALPIYVPYTLDETALQEFVRWQTDMHEKLISLKK